MANVIFRKLSDLFRGIVPTGQYAYLRDALNLNKNKGKKLTFWKTIPSLLQILETALLHQVGYTATKLKNRLEGATLSDKWNSIYQNDVVLTSKLHAAYTIGTIFYEQILTQEMPHGLRNSMLRLCKIYLWSMIFKYGSDILLHGNLDCQALIDLRSWYDKLVSKTRDQTLELIECVDPLHQFGNIHSFNSRISQLNRIKLEKFIGESQKQ